MSEPTKPPPQYEDRVNMRARLRPFLPPIARFCGEERLRFSMFVVASGLSVPVNLASRVLFSLVVPFEIAVVLSHICGMVTAFTLSKLFVFEPSGRPVWSEFTKFTLVNMVSLAQTWIVAVGLVKFVWPLVGMSFYPELTGHFIGLATSAITSYVGHKRLSFAQSDEGHTLKAKTNRRTTMEPGRPPRFR
jgi:putative flippase GtrA